MSQRAWFRRLFVSAMTVVVAACSGSTAPQLSNEPTVSSSIVNGVAIGSAFASVGNVVRLDRTPPSRCSGTLIAPDVFLTAGHCAVALSRLAHGQFGVSFDPTYTNGDTASLHFGTVFAHPGMEGSDPILNDVGIIVLDEPVENVHPSRIAERNFLSQIDPAVLARRRVLTVGYGATDTFNATEGRGTRRFALAQVIGISGPEFGYDEENWLALEMAGVGMLGNPGAGDSGGPDFLDDRIVAITSTGFPDVVLSQRIDLPEVQDFIRSFLSPESPNP